MISLTKKQIDSALPKIEKYLEKYLWLQDNLYKCDVSTNKMYQKKFNSFYRVAHRNKQWMKLFYNLFETKKEFKSDFGLILLIMWTKLKKRLEASFSSKMAATMNPNLPIIDSVVLKNIGLKLPGPKEKSRLIKTEKLYKKIIKMYSKFLISSNGKYLIVQFKKKFPGIKITKIKMLDFVLWQTRN